MEAHMKRLLSLSFLAFLLPLPASAQDVVFFGQYPSAPFTCDGQTKFASYGDSTLVALQVCDGTSWKTLTTSSGTLNTVPKFTPDATTLGNSTITDDGTVVTVNTRSVFGESVANDGSRKFLRITGTLPSAPSAEPVGVATYIATAGTSSLTLYGSQLALSAGHTGSGQVVGAYFDVNVAGTDTTYGNEAIQAFAFANTTGTNRGIHSEAYSGDLNIAISGLSGDQAKANSTHIGVQGFAKNTGTNGKEIGGFFALRGALAAPPTPESAALLADNSDRAVPIFIARDNGTKVFEIKDGGVLKLAAANYIEGTEAAAPGTPAAGQVILYAKSGAPGEFCSKDDGGVETCMSAGAGGSGLTRAEVMIVTSYGGF
jgi:hypothetical protein